MRRIGLVVGLLLGLTVPANAQALIPNAEQTFLDQNGTPLAAGDVYFYIPSTLTPKTTYSNQGLSVPNTNPVVLDAAGRGIIWGSGSYREIVKDQFGNTIWDQVTYGQVIPLAMPEPTQTVLTAASGTYTTPAGATHLWVRMVGGGGGGGGSATSTGGSNGGTGGDTVFNGIHAAGGIGGTVGVAAGNPSGGAGGTGGSGAASVRFPGGGGTGGLAAAVNGNQSGSGGSSIFGGGAASSSGAGIAAVANSGGGASGAAIGNTGYSGAGGGGGEGAELLINSPAGTYGYTVGAGGTAGAAGSGGAAGGAGGTGEIIVQESYQ